MLDKELIDRLREIKEKNNWTLYDLSKRLDIQVATLERWLKTCRINKVYARLVRDKLSI